MKNSTDRRPNISIGNNKKKLLVYLAKINKENVPYSTTDAHRNTRIKRTTIYDILRSLKIDGLVDIEADGKYESFHTTKITTKGLAVLISVGSVENTVAGSVGGSAATENLRPHAFGFKIKIMETPADWKNNIVGEIKNSYFLSKNNMVTDIDYDEDVEVRVFTSSLMIYPKNIFNQDAVKATEEAFMRTMKVIQDMLKVGFKLQDESGKVKIVQTDGEYAHVESILAKWLNRRMGKGYNVVDKNGTMLFWIDFSHKKLEDETPDEEKRENLDANMEQLLTKEYDFNDLEKKGELALKIAIRNTESLFVIRKTIEKSILRLPEEEQELDPRDSVYIG